MEKKKVLIPGGRDSDWALVRAAHRMGMYVITSGMRPEDPAHKFSDEYVQADYSDKEAMLALAKEKEIDYMVSNSNDYGMLSTAYVCEKLGLPGHDSYETTVKIHTKDTFKAACKKLGVRAPVSEFFEDRDEAIAYLRNADKKMIIKPVDNVGSNGVGVPLSKADFEPMVDHAFANTKKGKILIEPYITGFFAPATSMIINKKVVAFFCSAGLRYREGERPGREYPSYDKNNGIMSPCPFMDEFAPRVIEDFEKLAREFDMVDGKFHCELMITPEHEAYLFDAHRRMSGFPEPSSEWNPYMDWGPGTTWENWIIKAECGMDLSDFPVGMKQDRMVHFRSIYAPKDGYIRRVVLDEYLTSHIYPPTEEKNRILYDITVTDHVHQPVVDVIAKMGANDVRGNYLKFSFDNEEEWLRMSLPENDEFYKHISFEYYD